MCFEQFSFGLKLPKLHKLWSWITLNTMKWCEITSWPFLFSNFWISSQLFWLKMQISEWNCWKFQTIKTETLPRGLKAWLIQSFKILVCQICSYWMSDILATKGPCSFSSWYLTKLPMFCVLKDIYCLNADGCLFDAALLSAVATFSHCKFILAQP